MIRSLKTLTGFCGDGPSINRLLEAPLRVAIFPTLQKAVGWFVVLGRNWE